jgi:hypothetical protein
MRPAPAAISAAKPTTVRHRPATFNASRMKELS